MNPISPQTSLKTVIVMIIAKADDGPQNLFQSQKRHIFFFFQKYIFLFTRDKVKPK